MIILQFVQIFVQYFDPFLWKRKKLSKFFRNESLPFDFLRFLSQRFANVVDVLELIRKENTFSMHRHLSSVLDIYIDEILSINFLPWNITSHIRLNQIEEKDFVSIYFQRDKIRSDRIDQHISIWQDIRDIVFHLEYPMKSSTNDRYNRLLFL